MLRALVVVLAFAGCESKVDKLDKALDKLEKKLDDNKVAKGLDKLDTDEATQHLTAARDAIAKGEMAAEDCSWADRAPDNDKTRDTVSQLKKLCKVDAPLAKATKAVAAAEKAKADQPEAPTLTECQSDEWAAAKRTFDADMATEPKWVDLKARWAKACPNEK